MTTTDEHLREVIDVHFDPKWGSAFWLDRAEGLGFDPRQEIHTVSDLIRFGPTSTELLATQSIAYMLPRKYHDRLSTCVTCETGGTTGSPRRTVYLKEEFHHAFVEPFLKAAEFMSFPRNLHWLYIGPSGPHVIGKGARECATEMGSVDPFTVDFDPRWVRKMSPESIARERYVEHVLNQADAILSTQEIGVLFATPPVLAALGARMPETQRDRILGIHLGGMAADTQFWERLTGEWFTKAKVMAGYGNTLAGVCPQLCFVPGQPPDYFAYGDRLVLSIQEPNETGRGNVMFHRLDLSAFLPNVLERDEAGSVENTEAGIRYGFHTMGIQDPSPPLSLEGIPADGLY